MAPHLVRSVRQARREFRRAVDGMSASDREKRVGGINSIAWMAGHLGWQEQAYWLTSRGEPAVADLAAYKNGAPPCEGSFDALFASWEAVTTAADGWLEGLTEDDLRTLWRDAVSSRSRTSARC